MIVTGKKVCYGLFGRWLEEKSARVRGKIYVFRLAWSSLPGLSERFSLGHILLSNPHPHTEARPLDLPDDSKTDPR